MTVQSWAAVGIKHSADWVDRLLTAWSSFRYTIVGFINLSDMYDTQVLESLSAIRFYRFNSFQTSSQTQFRPDAVQLLHYCCGVCVYLLSVITTMSLVSYELERRYELVKIVMTESWWPIFASETSATQHTTVTAVHFLHSEVLHSKLRDWRISLSGIKLSRQSQSLVSGGRLLAADVSDVDSPKKHLILAILR